MTQNETYGSGMNQGLIVCGIGDEVIVDKAIQSDINIKMLTDLAPTIIWTRDHDGKLTYLNNYWFEFTGVKYTLDEMSLWQESIHPDDTVGLREKLNDSIAAGESYESEIRIKRHDGEFRWFRISTRGLYDEQGKIVQHLGIASPIHELKLAQHQALVAHDELERKVAERTRALEETQHQVLEEINARQKMEDALRQAQKMESVGQLTGGIAHDFNNMLTVIIGNLELLKMSAPNLGDSPVAKRMDKNVNMAIEAALKAEKLTSQLLAFSRKARLHPERLDVNKVILGVKEMVDRAVGMAITCEMDLQENVWLCLSDKTQLESAIINLSINARDAMMPKGGTLRIFSQNKMIGDQKYVSVGVKDTGTGIAPEILEKVFEPFFTTKDVGKGSGLGLSMVHGFCQQSNGKVFIDSVVGEGTCVEMIFPYTAGDVIAVTQDNEDFNYDENKRSILVVDDEPAVRELACQLLTDLGYNVVSAENGSEAIGFLQDADIPIDLLFTDVVMPGGVDGFQVAKAAQLLRPGIPIIFTTGHAEIALNELKKDLSQKLKVIGKPYRLNELSQAIAHELQ